MGFVELYPLFKVWPLGQRVGEVGFTRTVGHGEIILLKEMGPSGLLAVEILRFFKVCKILVIGQDFKQMGSIDEISIVKAWA